MTDLSIHLLGTFHVSHQGQAVSGFRSERDRALLAFLAVERDRPHRRETLMSIMWPDMPEEQAHNNMRVNLHRLHKVLQLASGKVDFLLVGRNDVQVNPLADVWLDVTAFQTHLEEARRLGPTSNSAALEHLRQLANAAALYRGEFMQGFTFDHSPVFDYWTTTMREKLHREVLHTLSELAELHQLRGELQVAVEYARRQLELEPWREKAHRQLMGLLARHGEREAALAQYEQCRRILAEELGEEPSFETQSLYNHIRKSRGRKRPILPAVSTNFVGREQERAKIIHSLSKPECRLLTLIGMGGVGKTRLAAQIANQLEYAFLDGVIFVSLAVIHMPDQIPNAIADALGFAFSGSNDPFEQLLNSLENKEYLIVLDNFEHLLEAVPLLVKIWERCPGIKMLVTSRVRLGLEQEYLVELEGLPTLLSTDPAVDLLMMCIHKLEPSFDPSEQELKRMVELCGRVEGMPLALELVAPMTRVLSIQEIINGIQTHELPGLDAVFERSWTLLAPEERIGFMQLSIFNTPFTRESAQEVAQVDLAMLTSLVDKSLIRRVTFRIENKGGHETLYFDFHPLLKQFAYQKLKEEPEALSRSRERHADYFLGMVDRLYESILTPDESQAIKKIHDRHEDIVVAMKWGCNLARYESVRKGLHIHSHYFENYCAFRLGKYFFGELVQLLREIKRQQENPPNALDQILARAIAYYGWHLMRLGDYHGALEHEREAIQLARESREVCMEAGALIAIGAIQQRLGDLELSNQYFEFALEAAKRAEGQLEGRWYVTGAYHNLGDNALTQSKLDLADEYFALALERHKEIGHYWGIADLHLAYGRLFMQQGHYEKARMSLQDGLAFAETHNYLWLKNRSLVRLGDLAFKQEDWETAVRYYQESFDSIEEFGNEILLEETRRKFMEANRLIRGR